jgi:hypothetical protein
MRGRFDSPAGQSRPGVTRGCECQIERVDTRSRNRVLGVPAAAETDLRQARSRRAGRRPDVTRAVIVRRITTTSRSGFIRQPQRRTIIQPSSVTRRRLRPHAVGLAAVSKAVRKCGDPGRTQVGPCERARSARRLHRNGSKPDLARQPLSRVGRVPGSRRSAARVRGTAVAHAGASRTRDVQQSGTTLVDGAGEPETVDSVPARSDRVHVPRR